jgi:hypothetical protein
MASRLLIFCLEVEPMDRSDERRSVNDTEETSATFREGDVLGLGGSTVPKAPGDPATSDDPESLRRRRERAMGSDEESRLRHEDPDRQRSGATGIDMGSGGQGTHVSGE